MSDDGLRILMHQELDGVNTPDESARLRRALDADAELRREFAELRAAVGLLESAETPAAPADLRRRILDGVAVADRRPSGAAAAWGASSAGRRRVVAVSFAAGLAAGVALLAALGPWLSDEEAARTRGSVWTTESAAEGWRDLAGAGWHGAVRSEAVAEGLLCELRIDGGAAGPLTLDLPAGARCTGFSLDRDAAWSIENHGAVIIMRGEGAARIRIQLDLSGVRSGSLLLRGPADARAVPLAAWPTAAE